MGSIANYRKLSPDRRRLLRRAGTLLLRLRVELRIVSYQRIFARLERQAIRERERDNAIQISPDEIVWAVTTAANRLRGTTCLPQALAGNYLLTRYGHPSRIRFGVTKRVDGRFAAHAWVESGDRVLIGGETDLDYAPLPPLPSSPQDVA